MASGSTCEEESSSVTRETAISAEKPTSERRRRKVDTEIAERTNYPQTDAEISDMERRKREVLRMAEANRNYASIKRVEKEKRKEELRTYTGLVQIPDSAFNAYLLAHFDTNADGRISGAEARAVKTMDCAALGIDSLNGIEYFTQLESLICARNRIHELDMTYNPSLRYLDCSQNKLYELEIRENTQLRALDCSYNNLVVIDVSNNQQLTTLYCRAARLMELDVTHNRKLTILDCGNNHLALLATQQNVLLDSLWCDGNKLEV